MHKRLLLSLCILGCLTLGVVGVYLLSAPALEQETMQEQTDTLIVSIENGDGLMEVDQPIQDRAVDFYDAPAQGDPVPVEMPPESLGNDDAGEPSRTVTGIGILEIPSIDLKMPVSYGASETTLKISAGWVPQTANIGSFGNAIIAGHRNYAYGSHFNRVGELSSGDSIQYTSAEGERMQFIVTDTLEVLPGDPAAFEQPEAVQMLTLYTCTPIRTATHRLLVRATRVA